VSAMPSARMRARMKSSQGCPAMRSATYHACHQIHEVLALEGGSAAEFLVRIEVTQGCQHAGIVQMPGRVNPIVARQAGAVGQQVGQGSLLVRAGC
jgi:hypothetical protein